MTMLAGISFVSPVMLAGSALVALPIVAHLLTRRARRRIVFPTIRLLSESAASTSKLYRIRRWLALLLRCLAVCLIAWAFSRPIWRADGAQSAASGEGAAVVLLVDTSASAGQHADGMRLVNALRALAVRTLDALENGTDQVGLVYASASPRAAFPELTGNHRVIRQELKRLDVTAQRADFPEAISQAGKLLSRHRGPRRLVILSDLQRSNWSGVTLKGRSGGAIPPGTVVTILPVPGRPGPNVSLSHPRSAPAQPIVKQPARVAVHVGNYSAAPRTVRVAASLDGQPIGDKQITVAGWGGAEVDFTAAVATPGLHRVRFSIGPDALSADNAAYLTLNAVSRAPVVVVGDDNPELPGTSTYFLIRALAPRGGSADDLEVRHLSGADLDYPRLADAEAVFVSYVGRLTPKALRALHMYANQGGGVVFCCGEGPVGANLLALGGVAKGEDILPWTPGRPRDLAKAGEILRIRDGAWRSRLLQDFDEPSQEALRQIRFKRAWSTGPLHPGAKGLLHFTDGTPAVAAQAVGAGRLVVCNFSPALVCSDLGKFGGFVALMQSLFHDLRPTARGGAGSAPGEPLTVSATMGPTGHLNVRGPDGRGRQVHATGGPVRVLVHVGRADRPGFYEVRQDERSVACAAVNVDARESDLRRMDPAVLREHLSGENMTLRIHAGGHGPVLRVRGRPLWHLFVLAAMAALGLELLLLCLWKQ